MPVVSAKSRGILPHSRVAWSLPAAPGAGALARGSLPERARLGDFLAFEPLVEILGGMRALVSLVAPIVVGFVTWGCEYVEAQPGSSSGQGGAVGEGGAGSDVETTAHDAPVGQASADSAVSTAERACQRVCSATTRSGCTDAETNAEVCTMNCEATLRGSCGSSFTDYVICAQEGGDVVCSYGPVVRQCEDLFWIFIDCAGLG
jgi:hypothetical protein